MIYFSPLYSISWTIFLLICEPALSFINPRLYHDTPHPSVTSSWHARSSCNLSLFVVLRVVYLVLLVVVTLYLNVQEYHDDARALRPLGLVGLLKLYRTGIMFQVAFQVQVACIECRCGFLFSILYYGSTKKKTFLEIEWYIGNQGKFLRVSICPAVLQTKFLSSSSLLLVPVTITTNLKRKTDDERIHIHRAASSSSNIS